jgi:hypothetical protein
MSEVNNWIHRLDIADGLKQLLIDTGITLEMIFRLDYQLVVDMLHTDPYIGKLIVEALHKLAQKRKSIS